MPPTGNPAAKQKILRASERLFAQQGYDSTSMDQIAARAGVNKALIYYYFKNKQHLRDSLFSKLMEDSIALMDARLQTMPQKYAKHLSEMPVEDLMKKYPGSYFDDLIAEMVDFFEKNRNVLKIIMMESFKAKTDHPDIFKFFEVLFYDQVKKMAKSGLPYKIDNTQMIYEFFTGFMPMINFIILHDQWARHFKMDEQDLKADFVRSFIKTHIMHTELKPSDGRQ